MGKRTPWGESQYAKQIADGVVHYSTAGHGGWELNPARHAALQRRFKFNTFAGGQWYEEDCDVCAVVIAFPTMFSTGQVVRAVKSAECFKKWEISDGKTDGNWHRVVAYCEKCETIKRVMEQETAILAAE